MREMISHAYVAQEARENRKREANAEMAAQLSRRLLEITDLRLQDIVLRVGYVDAASFSRKFKAIEGESPNEYRVRRREGRI